MEIVINKCFGGFSISIKAMLYLIRKDSSLVKTMSFDEYTGGRKSKLVGYELSRWHDVGDGFYATYLDSVLYDKDCKNVWFSDVRDDEQRTHPDLIDVVRTLGEDANGQFSKLEIVDIPDDVEWEISDYDGLESVEEKHRSW